MKKSRFNLWVPWHIASIVVILLPIATGYMGDIQTTSLCVDYIAYHWGSCNNCNLYNYQVG